MTLLSSTSTALLITLLLHSVDAFSVQGQSSLLSSPVCRKCGTNVAIQTSVYLSSSASSTGGSTAEEDEMIQWDLLLKHHAKGSWKGVWTTYDYMGDMQDETVASVDLQPPADGDDDEKGRVVQHSHTFVVGAKRSDCPTCFDSMETKTLPVGEYRENQMLLRKTRLAGVSMVNGPSILRSGAMATELILASGDGRVRVTFQHAPVWEAGVEPGSCPPQGLKLFRVILSREALRSAPPTAETEAADPPTDGNPIFFRSVPPYNWHKKWSGTSWTWGPQRGNQGWSVEDLDETDAWQGITPIDCWNLRLGSIHMQAPRVVTDATVGICRLAWLPTDDKLLRVEAGVSALQPMTLDDEMMIGFEPPSLTSLRCDMFSKVGELDDPSRPFRNSGSAESSSSPSTDLSKQDSSDIPSVVTDDKTAEESTSKSQETRSTSSAHRDALSL